MKVFIMAILLGQLDLTGDIFYTSFEENPKKQFSTIEKCLDASKVKGEEMFESSLKYPELGIVHIKIDCVEVKSSKEGTI